MRPSSTAPGIPPIFIGGAGRSGTTLVVDVLGLHPQLTPIYETDFVLWLCKLFGAGDATPAGELLVRANEFRRRVYQWAEPLPLRSHNKRAHERYVHGPHFIPWDAATMRSRTDELVRRLAPGAVDVEVRAYVRDLFDAGARREGTASWVNKVPAYVHVLEILRRWFPDMVFVHVVRDGRDTAFSAMTRPWGPKTVPDAAAWWEAQVLPALRWGHAYPAQYVELRYEQLVREPEHTLGELLNVLPGVDAESATVDGMLARAIPMDPAMLDKWRAHERDQVAAFEATAGPLLTHFGYGLSTVSTELSR